MEKTKEEAQALCDATIVDESGNRLGVLESISQSIDSEGNETVHETRSTSSLETYPFLP